MQIVQMRGDLGGTEPDVIIRQLIVDTADDRLAVACEDRGARVVASGVLPMNPQMGCGG